MHIRHALANLTAAIIASPRRGNTLWYHLFAPEELYDTCIPGFLVCDDAHILLLVIIPCIIISFSLMKRLMEIHITTTVELS